MQSLQLHLNQCSMRNCLQQAQRLCCECDTARTCAKSGIEVGTVRGRVACLAISGRKTKSPASSSVAEIRRVLIIAVPAEVRVPSLRWIVRAICFVALR